MTIYLPTDLAAKPYIKEIYTKIGSDWTTLAIILNFSRVEIDVIKNDNRNNTYEQCHVMLSQYLKINGSSFTKLVLAQALVKAELLDIAESHHLFEICKEDNSKERNHGNLQNEDLSGKQKSLLIDFSILIVMVSYFVNCF